MLLITKLEVEQVLDCLRQMKEDPLEDYDLDDSIEILEGVLEQYDIPIEQIIGACDAKPYSR